MVSFSTKLNTSFHDFELLGAKQSISLVVKLTGILNIELLRRNISLLPRQFREITFSPVLRLIPGNPDLQKVSAIFSSGIQQDPIEFYLIGGRSEFILIILYHHSFCDGLGGLEVFRRIVEPKEKINWDREEEALREFNIEENRYRSLLKGLVAGTRCLFSLKSHSNNYGNNNSSLRKVSTISKPISEIRALKSKLECSLNDIYLYGVSQVLSSFYPDRKTETVLVPVNLRPRGLRATLGNFLLVVPVDLPLHSKLDLNFLSSISKILDSPSNISRFRSARGAIVRLPKFIRLPILSRLASTSTCIATYVPDGVTKRELCGAKITSEFGMPALLPGHEIGFCLITTKEEFSVSIVTSGRLIEEGERAKGIFERVMSC